METPLILASGSTTRAEMLRRAGIEFEVRPPRVDEAAVKAALLQDGAAPRDIADALAELKAMRVSAKAPGRLVLGADQVLTMEGRVFDKPRDRQEARAQLESLRGHRHQLISAAVVAEDGRPVWRHVGLARLTMRPFSDAFLEGYLAAQGDRLTQTVGAYRIEEGGSALFDRVEGDHFVVLGLPLFELLGYLRLRGLAPT